jgi:acyl-CoA synthetase (NDP forming)
LARNAGLLLAGPNTIGMVNADCGMMGSFVEFPHWEKGKISILAQTGIFAGGVMLDVMGAPAQRLPASKSIDVGNKIDVDEIDFLNFAAGDPDTKVIGLYLESIADPDLFLKVAADLRGRKPIVILKPGRTKEGAAASALHTGTVTPEEASLDARLRAAGIVRAEDESDFVDALRTLAMLPRAKGRRVAIATTSGALGVISTDLIVQQGLKLAAFAPATIDRLKTVLPDWATSTNPYDFWTGVEIKGSRAAHETAFEAVCADPNVDMVLFTLLAAAASDFPEFSDVVRRIRGTYDKPMALVIYGGRERHRWISGLEGADVPVFSTTKTAVRALSMLAQASE